MVAFASGGRGRSEIASLRLEQLTVEAPIETEGGPPLACHPSRPHKNDEWRGGRCRLSHRPASRGTQRVDGCGKYRQGQRVSRDWALGHGFEAGARYAVNQRDLEAKGGNGRVGAGGVFGARVAVRLSDRGRQPRHPAPGGDGAITPPIRSASIELL
jgi:hypothetical protein